MPEPVVVSLVDAHCGRLPFISVTPRLPSTARPAAAGAAGVTKYVDDCTAGCRSATLAISPTTTLAKLPCGARTYISPDTPPPAPVSPP